MTLIHENSFRPTSDTCDTMHTNSHWRTKVLGEHIDSGANFCLLCTTERDVEYEMITTQRHTKKKRKNVPLA